MILWADLQFIYLLIGDSLVNIICVGGRKVFVVAITNISCEVSIRMNHFQLVSSEGDTLLPANLCEKGKN